MSRVDIINVTNIEYTLVIFYHTMVYNNVINVTITVNRTLTRNK